MPAPTSYAWCRSGASGPLIENGPKYTDATTARLRTNYVSSADEGPHTLEVGYRFRIVRGEAVLAVIPRCRTVFNESDAASVQNLFDYLSVCFGGCP
ncbi:MAG: hypothetical protein IT438_04430 [Phycisphaerales bacterium]|nr:hypothetical protein [Phycisphaerales bacterium]